MTCRHADPLAGLGYVAASERAEKLLAGGWKQLKCGTCGLWRIYVKPTRLEKLLAKEKILRAEHKKVGIQKTKLEVKLAKLRQQVEAEATKTTRDFERLAGGR